MLDAVLSRKIGIKPGRFNISAYVGMACLRYNLSREHADVIADGGVETKSFVRGGSVGRRCIGDFPIWSRGRLNLRFFHIVRFM